ncbi:13421_t:CDS:1, partial [Dentiscutata heterogama]
STKCCFSLGYNATQSPHLYRVNVSASHVDSRKHNNEYVVMISFPTGYIVQDNLSSPYSYVSCLRKDDSNFAYKCDSKDKLTFYVEMTMLISQFPENNTLSATVYIYGDQCNQQDVCPDLAALADSTNNNDKVSLGPFGSWSKVGVVVFGCALVFILLLVCFVIVRRNAIANLNSKRSTYLHEVHDDPNQDSPSHIVNDDNSITSTNFGNKTSFRNMHNSKSTIEKSSNDDFNNIKRSEVQRAKSSRKKQSEFNV